MEKLNAKKIFDFANRSSTVLFLQTLNIAKSCYKFNYLLLVAIDSPLHWLKVYPI